MVDVGHYRNLYTTHYALAFMRTLTALHSLKTAIKHISKDIVGPSRKAQTTATVDSCFALIGAHQHSAPMMSFHIPRIYIL